MEGAEHESAPEGAGGPGAAGGGPDGQERSVLGLWFARFSRGQRIAIVVVVLAIVAAAIAVPIALVGGGGGGGTYPANVRANFLRACETNASTSLCNCALQKIEAQVSFHQFAQDEASYRRTGQLPSYYRSVVIACLGR